MSTIDPAFTDAPSVGPDVAEPSVGGIPLNRIVAFLGPHVSWLAGVVATWLTTHLHLLATFHVGQSDLAKALSAAIVFTVVTLVTWLGHQKWLEGFQVWAYGKHTSADPKLAAQDLLSGPVADPSSGTGPSGVAFDTGGPSKLVLSEDDIETVVDPTTVTDADEAADPPPPTQS